MGGLDQMSISHFVSHGQMMVETLAITRVNWFDWLDGFDGWDHDYCTMTFRRQLVTRSERLIAICRQKHSASEGRLNFWVSTFFPGTPGLSFVQTSTEIISTPLGEVDCRCESWCEFFPVDV
jgi:hypothetical protein